MRIRTLCLALTALAVFWCCFACAAQAQQKGEPGNFDFYVMNLSWSPQFCSIRGTSAECPARVAAHPGFVLHGLWPQNNDGSYPVFCSDERGPAHPAENLDLTPDLSLLKHEWAKHGTCSGVGPRRFFAMEHWAFHSLHIPPQIEQIGHQADYPTGSHEHVEQEISMAPGAILSAFAAANPNFPRGSILLSCGRNHLTAVEACFSKDLKPMACRGLRTCRASAVEVTRPAIPGSR